MAIANYTLAVDRKFKRDGEDNVDFISCTAFRRAAEFAEKYFRQGLKITVSGYIQTGSYTNRDGQKVYTTKVIIEEQEFAESKKSSDSAGNRQNGGHRADAETDFMQIPDGIDDSELPFA